MTNKNNNNLQDSATEGLLVQCDSGIQYAEAHMLQAKQVI